MAAFLGICRTLAFLNHKPGQEHFWCIGGSSSKAQKGDLLLMYYPVSASPKYSGIAQVYEIITLALNPIHSQCYSFGMVPVETKLLFNLPEHIKIAEMKHNTILAKWGAIGRNFQSVTFSMSEEMWDELRKIISARNPEIATQLNKFIS